MLERGKARDWLGAAVLATFGWVLVWSAGVVFTGGDQLLASTRALEDQIRPLQNEIDASHALLTTLNRVDSHAEDRSRTIARSAPPDTTRPRPERIAHWDTLARFAYFNFDDAGNDSLSIASVRVLTLSNPDLNLVSMAEDMLGAERAMWLSLSRWSSLRHAGKPFALPGDTTLAAIARASLTRRGFAAGFDRSRTTDSTRVYVLSRLVDRRNDAASKAFREFLLANLLLPLSILALFALYRFALTGSWSLPFWRGATVQTNSEPSADSG